MDQATKATFKRLSFGQKRWIVEKGIPQMLKNFRNTNHQVMNAKTLSDLLFHQGVRNWVWQHFFLLILIGH